MAKLNVILVVQLCTIVLASGKLFRSDYTYYHEAGGWLKLHNIPALWKDARLRCSLEGSILASPVDNKMRAILRRAAGKTVFTGISATISKGYYSSVEGTALEKIDVDWAPNEPNNFENKEDCLIMYTNGTMADVECENVYPYVCYKKEQEDMKEPTDCGTIDQGYKLSPQTGHCYKFHTAGQTWPEASMTCAAEGGHLAVINSNAEADVLRDLFTKNPSHTVTNSKYPNIALIGFMDISNHGRWVTVHGQTIEDAGYVIWGGTRNPAISQPDNSTIESPNGEFCGSIFRNVKMNDAWCDVTFPFICEMAPEPVRDKQAPTEMQPRNL